MSHLLNDLRLNNLIEGCNSFGEYHHITFKNGNLKNNINLLDDLKNKGYQAIEIKEIVPTIEDCFINLMQIKNDK